MANRTAALRVSGLLLAYVFTTHPLAAADPKSRPSTPPTSYDPHLYLLVDDYWIDEQQGLTRIVNQASPLDEPIIAPDDPATEADFAWGNVIRESDGRYRLWYGTMMMGQAGEGPHEMARGGVWGRGEDFSFHPRSKNDVREVETCLGKYAESNDGIHWTKPSLGLVSFRGSTENNILLTGAGPAEQTGGLITNFDGYTILRDDREPDPNRRYKMVAHWESVHCWDNHEISGSLGRAQDVLDKYWAARGEYITYSPDGLHWNQPLERIRFPNGGGDRMLVIPDHRHQRWMAYTRAGGWAYPAFSYSEDLIEWSEPEPAKHITPDSVQAPAVECMIPFNYGELDLGFACGMDKPRGVFTVLLASRRDGHEWQWVDKHSMIIPHGPRGSYYATGAVPLHNEPIIVGDRMLIYFNAFSRDKEHPCPKGSRTIGVAIMRRDGFAGLKAIGEEAGHLTTRPLTVAHPHLRANVEFRDGTGSVQFALLDEDGQELPGFTFSDCEPIVHDQTRAQVAWKQQKDLSQVMGQKIRIAARLQGSAILYALAFQEAG